ncbi:MAG: DUF4234 domain-containing protein [Lachnospiraceae bacterium]|nr:DUF4234 domain-containing protein [Lachnospiraceae bacterium]
MNIKNRNIALCIIFSIITCGIYTFYWIYCLNEEANSVAGETDYMNGALVIILGVVTGGIFWWYWLYKMGEKCDVIKQNQGMNTSNSAVLFLILGIVGLAIVSFALIQDTLNHVAA